MAAAGGRAVVARAARLAASLLVALCACACGAKTGLLAPERDAALDAPRDAADAADAPPPDGPPPRTYLGTEFWAVSTTNSWLRSADRFHFAVALGNPSDAPVSVTITGGGLFEPMRFTLLPRTAETRVLPWVDGLAQRSNATGGCGPLDPMRHLAPRSVLSTNGAYRIQSSAPINAYQFNPLEFEAFDVCRSNSYTNDASLLLPTAALTNEYLVLAYPGFSGEGSGFVAVVGTQEAPTTVTVTPSELVREGPGVAATMPGTTQTYTLARGQVLQLVSDSGARSGDLTGTVVRASAPVAVFAGVDCALVSLNNDQFACDHIEEQIFPTETWGREVVVSQLRDRGRDERYIVRILSREGGNALAFEPPSVHAPVTLGAGQMLNFESSADFVVRGTRPLLVAQYMQGQGTTPMASVGDPAMVLEVPTTQYRREYSFVVPSTYTASFINVTARAGTTVALDQRPLNVMPEAIPGTPWVVWRSAIAPGAHAIRTQAGGGFGLKVLGVAPYTSYAYPGGLDLSLMP